jgi:hypothetical protein
VKLVDSNVLIYAVNTEAEHHRASVTWLEATLSSGEGVIIPWLSVISFIRITTHPAIHPRPLSVARACDTVEGWLSVASVLTGDPDRQHARRMGDLLRPVGTGGNLVNDAYLAALALQYGATVISYDRDFALFPGVRSERPSAASAG